jgi:hypothetical protein
LLIQPIALPVSLSVRTFLSKYALCSMINGFLLSTQKIFFFYISLHIYLLITVYEYVECELREHRKGRLDDEPLEVQHYVPPLGAPKQQNQVPIEAWPPKKKRRCAWFPFCNKFVGQCNGYDRKSCLRANSGDFQTPTEDQFKEERKRYPPMRERRAARGKRREV